MGQWCGVFLGVQKGGAQLCDCATNHGHGDIAHIMAWHVSGWLCQLDECLSIHNPGLQLVTSMVVVLPGMMVVDYMWLWHDVYATGVLPSPPI